jgi:hypothetical protein
MLLKREVVVAGAVPEDGDPTTNPRESQLPNNNEKVLTTRMMRAATTVHTQ